MRHYLLNSYPNKLKDQIKSFNDQFGDKKTAFLQQDPEQRLSMCNQMASEFFVYNNLLTNLSTPIKFVETNSAQKNIFLISNIGDGKSTLGNKLIHLLRNNLEPP